ncbi:type 1 glutamine amidotransferase domain-containing protein [Falsarthrobacter nasiphocae]|uniref:Protease I n=1 Tax=Falsarthrobacter nasiphocae TaxID=189863 RepID=A0AAE4C7Y8_9MICC|nr:type 1 glutamine amidotransferase domain-containing protein [Falsarthrobacter nasiphocae]MDR6891865.1 protease I [Falsarthrobacter nasiphocae]
MADLTGKNVLILASQGVEQVELTSPRDTLSDAGATITLAAPSGKDFQALQGDWDRGETFSPDQAIDAVKADDFDALVLPGGTLNADALRQCEDTQALVRAFLDAGKPVAAICHAPWILIEAGVVKGRTLTSFASVATDLKNAGAEWVDQELAEDGGLITSRTPDDLEAFGNAIVKALSSNDDDAASA